MGVKEPFKNMFWSWTKGRNQIDVTNEKSRFGFVTFQAFNKQKEVFRSGLGNRQPAVAFNSLLLAKSLFQIQ